MTLKNCGGVGITRTSPLSSHQTQPLSSQAAVIEVDGTPGLSVMRGATSQEKNNAAAKAGQILIALLSTLDTQTLKKEK